MGSFMGAQKPTVCKYTVNEMQILFVENNAQLSFHADIQLTSKQGNRLRWHTEKEEKFKTSFKIWSKDNLLDIFFFFYIVI